MNTIADQHHEAWGKIENAGFVSLASMARRFTSNRVMDSALGYSSAVNKWNKGKMPGAEAERKASEWLSKQGIPEPNTAGDMLLVVCPGGASQKVRRVLSLLGCEVEPI